MEYRGTQSVSQPQVSAVTASQYKCGSPCIYLVLKVLVCVILACLLYHYIKCMAPLALHFEQQQQQHLFMPK